MRQIKLGKLLEDTKECHKKVEIKVVHEAVIGSVAALYQGGSILKETEKALGEEKYNVLLTSLISSILLTVYVEGNFDKIEDGLAYAKTIGASGYVKCEDVGEA